MAAWALRVWCASDKLHGMVQQCDELGQSPEFDEFIDESIVI